MKKEVIGFSLFIFSILLLSGCQEPVGGRSVSAFCDERNSNYDRDICAALGGDTGNVLDEGGMFEANQQRDMEKFEIQQTLKELYGNNIRIGAIENGAAHVEVLDTRGNQIGAFVYDSKGVESTAQREPEEKTEYMLVQPTNDFLQESGNPETAEDDFEEFLQWLDGVELVGPIEAAVRRPTQDELNAEQAKTDKAAYDMLKTLMNLPKRAKPMMMTDAKVRVQLYADKVAPAGDKDVNGNRQNAIEKAQESQAMIEKYYKTTPGLEYFFEQATKFYDIEF